MTDEDQPSKKDEQVYWAPRADAPASGAGRDADRDDATAERPAAGHPGPAPFGAEAQNAGHEAQAAAGRSPQPSQHAQPVRSASSEQPPAPHGSSAGGQHSEGQHTAPHHSTPQHSAGQSVAAPVWPAYPPRAGDQSQPGQSQPGQSQFAPSAQGQSTYGQPSSQGQSTYGQSQGQTSQGQQYGAYPTPPTPSGQQSAYPGASQSGWSSPSGSSTGSWTADLGDTRPQANAQHPHQTPGQGGAPYPAPGPFSGNNTGPVAYGANNNPGNNLGNHPGHNPGAAPGQGGGNGAPLVPGLQPAWGPPSSVPHGRPNGRSSGRASLVAAALGVGLLAGVLGGFGGSALYDDVADSDGRAPTVSLPEPVRDNQDKTVGAVTGVASAVTPSVVSLEVVVGQSQGTGSGFVIDAENGYILTNNHVVSGDGSGSGEPTIQVVFQDGTQAKGTLVGADASYDLAVVKVRAKGLRELRFGDSDEVQVGDPVVAIGAPLGLTGTVTTGIVSALNRPVAAGEGDSPAFINAIQTDAAINPGNSGGPLVNTAGHVVAVNSAIARVPGTTDATGGSIGLGFAIPSNQAQRTAEQLIQTGKADHPIIGVTLDSTYTGEGVLVSSQAQNGQEPVTPGGPAEEAGIEPGDVITKFNGRPVTAPDELIVAIRAEKPGDTVTLTIRRGGGDEKDVKVKLSASSD